MFEWVRVTSLYGRAVSYNRKRRYEDALRVLHEAIELLKKPSVDPLSPWVLPKYILISVFLYRLGEQVGRPGVEREAVVRGLEVWKMQLDENPKLREVSDFAEWERWAMSYVANP